MSSLILPQDSSKPRKAVQRRSLSERMELGVGIFLFVSVSLICILALLFLSHSNRVATRGYELKVLQQKQANLVQQNEVLSMQVADMLSLDAMGKDEVIAAMIKVEQPKYIRGDTAVAKGNTGTGF
ncbi:hypothetical protein IPN35_04920 [Candidatus Peregrinibacteria bacterium]|nr:MAG: hypothetical protein IPN35_04920 [Candidatus Peregrinibacteria bacterium]